MSAETLRKAAALMRERAEAATPGPWSVHDFGYPGQGEPSSIVVHAGDFDWRAVADGDLIVSTPMWERQENDNAEHIASWHPAVALAVADLLREAEATYIVLSGPGVVGDPDSDEFIAAAVRLARAYLDEQP